MSDEDSDLEVLTNPPKKIVPIYDIDDMTTDRINPNQSTSNQSSKIRKLSDTNITNNIYEPNRKKIKIETKSNNGVYLQNKNPNIYFNTYIDIHIDRSQNCGYYF